MPSSDLPDFLLARIAEAEAMAQRVIPGLGSSGEIQIALHTTETLSDGTKRIYTDYVAPYDPTRVLAECEAKRRIVFMHGDSTGCRSCSGRVYDGHGPCDTLMALALPYSDHSDFRPEWRL